MIAEVLSELQSLADQVKVPEVNDRVFKNECVFSFDTPHSPDGLYVCLKTFLGMGRNFIEMHARRFNSRVFLRLKFVDKVVPLDEDANPPPKITKLAIGVEGGFPGEGSKPKIETVKSYSIVVFPNEICVPWPCEDLPDAIVESVQGVLNADAGMEAADFDAWDGEIRYISKHTDDLLQLEAGKIASEGWKCDVCGLTSNLWLNLTDGSILCGRRYFDGSGGNEHAALHYTATNYPLAVKLGTITKDGQADVYSYEEDDMVEDVNLEAHLAHFGIDMKEMKKSEKSMLELELDLNKNFGDYSRIMENGKTLEALYGPGYTGLINLGNSCYMNSVMQVVFSIPSFVEAYYANAAYVFEDNHRSSGLRPFEDFHIQMAKLGCGLLSGKYSRPPSYEGEMSYAVAPSMFKQAACKGNSTFSNKKQQDAQEFYMYFMGLLDRHFHGNNKINNKNGGGNPGQVLAFKVEERLECGESGKVSYKYRGETSLSLSIPPPVDDDDDAGMEWRRQCFDETPSPEYDASGSDGGGGGGEEKRARIDGVTLLEAFAGIEAVDDFYSVAAKKNVTALKSTRMASFPPFLLIHLKKYDAAGGFWAANKLNVSVDMPDVLDLSELAAKGLQAGEELMREEEEEENEELIGQLMSIGFGREISKKAVLHTKNGGLEEATNWVVEHMNDEDADIPASGSGSDNFKVNEDALNMLTSFGISRCHALRALKETNNDMERAGDWAFSHPEEVEMMEGESAGAATDSASASTPKGDIDVQGSKMYEMKAFITHMGNSLAVGHYICHIKKESGWVVYNDEKVARSENPPKDMGYLYLYEKINP